jgi:hypothetical protein
MDPIQMRVPTIPLGYSGDMNGIGSTSWISVSEPLRARLTLLANKNHHAILSPVDGN